MRRVRYCVAMSLDAYIAGPADEFDWIPMDPDIDFAGLYNEFDTLLLGRRTYEVTRQHPAPAVPGTRTYVFSQTLRQADCAGVTVSSDAETTVRALKEEEGKDIWLFGGGVLFENLLRMQLVDAVEVAIVPVLLGAGLPLRPSPASLTSLRLFEQRTYEKTGIVQLKYSVGDSGS